VRDDEAANDGDKRMKRSHDDAVGMDLDS